MYSLVLGVVLGAIISIVLIHLTMIIYGIFLGPMSSYRQGLYKGLPGFIIAYLKTTINIGSAFCDLLVLVRYSLRGKEKRTKDVEIYDGFAFLVHPRDMMDIYRPFPLFEYLPDWLVLKIVRFFPPILLSEITGVERENGEKVKGRLYAIVVPPQTMAKNPRHAVKRAVQCGLLAQAYGAKWIGLGALLPSLTRYGERYKEYVDSYITTGHALTSWTVCERIFDIGDILEMDLSKATIAIVGAAGSTGSACTKIIAKRNGIKGLILIDKEKRIEQLEKLGERVGEVNPNIEIVLGHELFILMDADIIICVTNATTAIIKDEHLRPGVVVLDDSQPRNVSPEIAQKRKDIIVIDVLAIKEGLDCNFDFGLLPHQPSITFTCLAETVILALVKWEGDFSIGIVDFEKIEKIGELAVEAGVSRFNNPILSFSHPVGAAKITKIKKINFTRGLKFVIP